MIKYDKLKNLESFDDIYDFKCPSCNKDGMKKNAFKLLPIGIGYKSSDTLDNSDIKNNTLRTGYDKLPTLKEALIQAHTQTNDNKGILFICNTCKTVFTVHGRLTMPNLKKWISKNIPFIMDLRIKE